MSSYKSFVTDEISEAGDIFVVLQLQDNPKKNTKYLSCIELIPEVWSSGSLSEDNEADSRTHCQAVYQSVAEEFYTKRGTTKFTYVEPTANARTAFRKMIMETVKEKFLSPIKDAKILILDGDSEAKLTSAGYELYYSLENEDLIDPETGEVFKS